VIVHADTIAKISRMVTHGRAIGGSVTFHDNGLPRVTQAVIKPFDYQRSIYNGSGLDHYEVTVAAYLAWLALTTADRSGWFESTHTEVGTACRMYRTTVAKSVDRLADRGWLAVRRDVQANQYKGFKFRLEMPVAGSDKQKGEPVAGSDKQKGEPVAGSDKQKGEPVAGSDKQKGEPVAGSDKQKGGSLSLGATQYVAGSDNEVRSTSKSLRPTRSSAAAEVATTIGQIKTAPDGPAQPQAAGPPDAEPGTLTGDEIRRILGPDPALSVACDSCGAEPGEQCKYLDPKSPRRVHHARRQKARRGGQA
jgi:hypothetical protein